MSSLEWWWLDTGWGCGGVGLDAAGRIAASCPIFRKLQGQRLKDLPYKATRLE